MRMSTQGATEIARLLRSTANPSRELIHRAADMLDLLVKRERDAQDIIHRRFSPRPPPPMAGKG